MLSVPYGTDNACCIGGVALIKAITCRDPEFLKTTYKHDAIITLVNHEGEIKDNENYIKYDGLWRVYRMGRDRVPRSRGKYQSIFGAIFKAR